MQTLAALTVAAALVNACTALVLDMDAIYGSDQVLDVGLLAPSNECMGGWNAINPSFVRLPGSEDVAVAFRGLCIKKDGPHASWHSTTVIGRAPVSAIRSQSRVTLPWKSLRLAPDLRFHNGSGVGDQAECRIPEFDAAQGPEDPRFVRTEDGLFAVVTGYSLEATNGEERPTCGEHGVVLHAAKVEGLSPVKFGPPVKLTFEGMGRVEKNWAMFTPMAARGSYVRAVYSMYPHKIASVSLSTGKVRFVSNSTSRALAKLAYQMGTAPENFHAGAGVAHVASEEGSYFLSVAHIVAHRENGRKAYWHFPYKFSAQPPYSIMHVGKRLKLRTLRNAAYGDMVAFVTTCMFDHGDVFIGYGAGDRSSRTLRMPLERFDAMYFPSSPEEDDEELAEDLGFEDMEFAETAAFGSDARACSNNNITQEHCSSELTPSVCRSCHDRAEENVTEEELLERSIDEEFFREEQELAEQEDEDAEDEDVDEAEGEEQPQAESEEPKVAEQEGQQAKQQDQQGE